MNNKRLSSRILSGLALLTLCLLFSLLAGWAQANVFTFERPPRVHEIGLADLTGNGYLDAYLAIGHGSGEPYIHPDYVLFNEGDGRFQLTAAKAWQIGTASPSSWRTLMAMATQMWLLATSGAVS
jgi:hypothetical protein